MKNRIAVSLSAIALITLGSAAVHAQEHGAKGGMKDKTNKMFDKVDANQDGQVELSEFLANAESRFKTMDLNQDGYVTKDEGQEAHKAMREKRKAKRKQRREENENAGPA